MLANPVDELAHIKEKLGDFIVKKMNQKYDIKVRNLQNFINKEKKVKKTSLTQILREDFLPINTDHSFPASFRSFHQQAQSKLNQSKDTSTIAVP